MGARPLYRLGPIEDPAGDWMTRQLNVDPKASAHIAMLRLGPWTNLELFEYRAPDQRSLIPRNSDVGGHHVAIYVEDVDTAVEYLRAQPGVRVLGEPQTLTDGILAGVRWVYFTTPWGMQMEVLNVPEGMPYEQRVPNGLAPVAASWDG
jgi:hypothetical protein